MSEKKKKKMKKIWQVLDQMPTTSHLVKRPCPVLSWNQVKLQGTVQNNYAKATSQELLYSFTGNLFSSESEEFPIGHKKIHTST
jgi:hypothetical protein